jgi:hypothetical protein
MSDKGAVVKSKKKISWVFVLFLLFILVLAFLIYTSFYNPEFIQNITGNVINRDIITGISIQANLNSPDNFKTTSEIDKMDLKISGAFLIDNKKYDLDTASIIIDNFEGEVGFDSKNLNVNGKATKIFVEGIPITGKLKIDLNNKYSYFKFNNVYVSDLSYESSGIVKIQDDKVIVNLENDKFSLKKFIGDIEKSGNNNFKIDGLAEEINAGSINIKS